MVNYAEGLARLGCDFCPWRGPFFLTEGESVADAQRRGCEVIFPHCACPRCNEAGGSAAWEIRYTLGDEDE